MFRVATGFLLITVLTSCSRPEFAPMVLEGPLPTTELIQHAEAIIVGVIADLQFGRKRHFTVSLFPQLNDCLAPVRVTVSVENSLRGSIQSRRLDFFYFATLCGTMGPVESPQYGARRIFFLRRNGGQWRTLADYWRNTVPVLTGSHGNDFALGKPIEQAIAEILLTPGEGCATKSLLHALATSTPESAALVGPVQTQRLLRPLLKHPDLNIRTSACLELGDLGSAGDDSHCADQLVQENLDILTQRGFWGVLPGSAFELGRLADHSDPATRVRARRFLAYGKTVQEAPPAPQPPLPSGLR